MVSVLIVAPEDDLHAQAVTGSLRRIGITTDHVDLARLSSGVSLTLSLNGEADASLGLPPDRSIMLSEVDTIWWRRPRAPHHAASADDASREFVQGEWTHFINALQSFAGVRWVNSPTADYRAGIKGAQLLAARAEGLRVPRTLITNDPAAVRSLAAEGIPLVYKRVGTGCRPRTVTRPLLPCDLGRLDALPNCPAIFQERIEAALDIRVTAIGGELYAAEIDSQSGDAPLDWRLDLSVPFRRHALDHDTSRQLSAILRRLGLLYAAIDLRLTPQGEYVFLEVNPSGQYLFVELLAGLPLTEKMAAFLAQSR